MKPITTSEIVSAPPAATFAAFSDFHNAERNVRGIKKLELLTEGPIGKGTRFRETRIMFGREATETMEIIDWQPTARVPSYSIGGESCGARFLTAFRFHPERGGSVTRVEMEMSFTPIGFMAKLMSPLAKLMLGPMKKCMRADFADMKRVAESGAPVAATPAGP